MTRDEIAAELLALVLEIGNGVGKVDDDPLTIARRAYIRGLASYAVLQLRDRVIDGKLGDGIKLLIEDQR